MRKMNSWFIWSGILIFAQSLIINKIQVYGFLNPYIYVAIFMLAPTSVGKMPLVLIGGLVGGFMDLVLLTGGMHLMASTLICFFQPKILGYIVPRADEENLGFTPSEIGIPKWLIYSGSTILIHHTYLFFVDSHSFNAPLYLFWRIIISTITTTILTTSILFFIKNK
tara:strand:+ start:3837 stop:4337 length:501 start_codon:yes stop_codon:yes gene_type:complete